MSFPCFIASEAEELKDYDCPLKFIRLTYMDLTDRMLEILKADKTVVGFIKYTSSEWGWLATCGYA